MEFIIHIFSALRHFVYTFFRAKYFEFTLVKYLSTFLWHCCFFFYNPLPPPLLSNSLSLPPCLKVLKVLNSQFVTTYFFLCIFYYRNLYLIHIRERAFFSLRIVYVNMCCVFLSSFTSINFYLFIFDEYKLIPFQSIIFVSMAITVLWFNTFILISFGFRLVVLKLIWVVTDKSKINSHAKNARWYRKP